MSNIGADMLTFCDENLVVDLILMNMLGYRTYEVFYHAEMIGVTVR